MKRPRPLVALLAALYIILWIGGIVTYATVGAPPEDARWTAPVFLLLAGMLTLVGTPRAEWPTLLFIAAAGFAAEALGVATGVPFGHYEYTATLAPRVLGVPLVMTLAWTVLLAFVRQIVGRWILPASVTALAGAASMTAIDLVIDPLASGALGYWRWVEPGPYYGIPLVNFLGWFVVSLVILLPLRRPPARSSVVALTGVSIVLFFSLIAIAIGLLLPGAIGIALGIAAGVVAWRGRTA